MPERHSPLPTRLALPWWDAWLSDARSEGSEPHLPAMRWLAARAARRQSPAGPWRDWMLDSAGLGRDATARFPAGPCVRAATDPVSASAGQWAVAQPVHLAAAIDHLRLAAPSQLDLSIEEATALHATVREHLAGTPFDLHCDRPQAWSLRVTAALECATREPADIVGRNVRDDMPSGRDGKVVRSLMNELQMLLHEHPVNERRARSGRPAVNSLWIWGFGALPPVDARALPALATDDPWLEGLWRLHGATATPLAGSPAAPGARTLLAWTRPASGSAEAALTEADGSVLHAACVALRQGSLRALEIHTGEHTIELDGRSRWRFWRRPRQQQP